MGKRASHGVSKREEIEGPFEKADFGNSQWVGRSIELRCGCGIVILAIITGMNEDTQAHSAL